MREQLVAGSLEEPSDGVGGSVNLCLVCARESGPSAECSSLACRMQAEEADDARRALREADAIRGHLVALSLEEPSAGVGASVYLCLVSAIASGLPLLPICLYRRHAFPSLSLLRTP